MAARFSMSASTLLTASGKVLAGGKINFFTSGTSTPLATYTTSALTVQNSEPLILDSEGRVGEAWANDTDVYSIQILDSDDNVVVPTFDSVSFIAAFSLSSADVLSALSTNTAAVAINGSQMTGNAFAVFADNLDLSAAGSIDASLGAITLGTVSGVTTLTDGIAGGLSLATAEISSPASGGFTMGASLTGGANLAGSGTTSDVSILNKNLSTVLSVATGTLNVVISGGLTVTTETFLNLPTVGTGTTGSLWNNSGVVNVVT